MLDGIQEMLRVAEHRAVLDRILRDSGLSADALELVPDVREWCRANGVEESYPFRQAKCVRRILTSRGTLLWLIRLLTR